MIYNISCWYLSGFDFEFRTHRFHNFISFGVFGTPLVRLWGLVVTASRIAYSAGFFWACSPSLATSCEDQFFFKLSFITQTSNFLQVFPALVCYSILVVCMLSAASTSCISSEFLFILLRSMCFGGHLWDT